MEVSSDTLHTNNKEEHDRWKIYWLKKGQEWRTQPEIDEQRKNYLAKAKLYKTVGQSNFHPFKDEVLSRADVEWLLATHESDNIYGPVNLNDENHRERQGINFIGANLTGLDLSHLPLTRMRGSVSSRETNREKHLFSSVNLEKADLTEAYLEEAYLIGAQMREAHLTGAVLREAFLSEAHLEDSFLNDADLEQADLAGSYLSRAHFIRANLERATLRGAHLENASFNEAYLKNIDGRGTYLSGANFTKAHLEHADFRRSQPNQEGPIFKLAFLEGANFHEAHLEGANLCEAHLEGADLRGAHLEGADLRGAHLAGADLRGAHLEGADLRGAFLNGKRLSIADRERIRKYPAPDPFPEIFPPADLREAFFSSATRLQGAVLGDAKYGFVSLVDVSWGGVNLSVIDWEKVQQIGDEQRIRNLREGVVTTGKRMTSGSNRIKSRKNQTKERDAAIDDYRAAVRANRQLAVVLQNQGLDEAAANFAYRAQNLHRKVLFLERRWPGYLFSAMLYLLIGYGHRPLRSLIAYSVIIISFMFVYRAIEPELTWGLALIFSSTAIFGRGLVPGDVTVDPIAYASLIEAFIGLIVEATFLAALVQRFFGK